VKLAALLLPPSRDHNNIALRGGCDRRTCRVVDYTIAPKPFTPGWELVLIKRSIALATRPCGGLRRVAGL